MSAPASGWLIVVRCTSTYRNTGRRCGRRLGYVAPGAAFAFPCPRCDGWTFDQPQSAARVPDLVTSGRPG